MALHNHSADFTKLTMLDAAQELSQRFARVIAELEGSARFLSSAYVEGLIGQEVRAATLAAQSPWLDRHAAAAYWHCSVNEIDRAASKGVLTRYERGETPLFRKEQGDEQLMNGKWKLNKPSKSSPLTQAAA